MEQEINRERITASVAERCAVDKDIGGWLPTLTGTPLRNAVRLHESGELASQVARDLGMSRATVYRRIRKPSITAS